GSPITAYKVYRSTSSGTETLLATIGNVLAYTDSTIASGNIYYYQVSAVNAAGEGARSAEQWASPATVPSAPIDVGTIPGDGIVALLWSPPESDGGSPITGYTATASPGGATCTASAITICAVGGLTNGIQYTFTVTATNAIGTGPASASVTATPTAGPTVPGAPTDLVATAGHGTVA